MEFRVHRFEELESTNTEASRPQYGHGDVIVARSQIKGRGQRGNYWHSSPGENLTVSVVVEPRFLPAGEQFALSQVVSLAVADTLGYFGIAPAIKWPNDIYVADRKIAGILIENDICGANLSRSIAGVGLNVLETGFPEHLPNPVSMAGVCAGSFTPEGLLVQFLNDLSLRYSELEAGNTDRITADYDSLLYRKGLRSPFRRPCGEEFFGTIAGVRDNGPLVVVLDDGREEEFLFKEIEYII